MITSEKLAIYREFGGDVDGWQRAGSPGEHTIIEGSDWSDLDAFLQELTILKKNLVSDDYGARIRIKLKDMTADSSTAKALLDMA